MSHTTEGGEYIYFHNGDYSGDIKIAFKTGKIIATVPFEEIKQLVADYIRLEKISRIEDMSNDEIFGL